jgi:hypothetical protein
MEPLMRQVVLLIGLMGLADCAIAGSSCVLVPKGQAAVTAPGGQNVALPSRLADCTGVRVAAGIVSACFLDGKGARQCRTLQSGEEFRPEALGVAAGDGGNAFKSTLVSLLKGDTQVKAGQTRTGQRHPGFPFGSIAALSGEFPMQPALALGTFSGGKFTLRAIGAPGWEHTWELDSTTIALPTDRLEPGREYAWTATGNERRLTGRLRMASSDELKRVREEMRAMEQAAGKDELAGAILGAELLAERGFVYEAERRLDRLRAEP